MNKYLWDDNKKWYGVLHQDGSLDTRVGVDGLFPLAYHLVENDRASFMESNFIKLIGQYGVRTVAQGEPGFREDVYWRGSAWPKTGSLGMEICRYYYPGLEKTVHTAVVNMTLKYPNIWECMNAASGELARSDHGFICTPGISSNVGAGEIIGSLFINRDFDMLGIQDKLPLTEIYNYHWAGLRISVRKAANGWLLNAVKAEKETGMINFVDSDGKIYSMEVKAGVEERIDC